MVKIPTGLNSLKSSTSFTPQQQEIIPVRVKFVSLNGDDYPLNWKKYGEYAGMGGILYEEIDNPGNQTLESLSFAKPLYSNISFLPLVNEIVYVISMPDPTVAENVSAGKQFYYFQTVNLWNNVHHNALPNTLANSSTNAQNYESTEAGVEVQSDESINDINLGLTFQERVGIRNLQPYEGDVLIEGRWGNTIRFGSTVNDSIPLNPWSNNGVNGEPITIIKNGQPTSGSSEGYLPITEDINNDLTSIYLTSTQNIPIEVASSKQDSGEAATVPFSNLAKQTPQSPKSYNAPQLILNSGRLLFNSTTDSIMVSSQKSILAEAREDIGLKSIGGNLTLQSDKGIVSLGGISSEQPIVRGTEFANSYATLLDAVELLIEAISKESSIPAAASSATLILNMIKEINVEDSSKFPFLSNKVKTI